MNEWGGEGNCTGEELSGKYVRGENCHTLVQKKIKRKRSDSGASGVVCTAYNRQDSRTAAVGGTVGAHAAAALNMS